VLGQYHPCLQKATELAALGKSLYAPMAAILVTANGISPGGYMPSHKNPHRLSQQRFRVTKSRGEAAITRFIRD
jgi:hypothetical protein